MVNRNHKNKRENEVSRPRGSQASLLAALLAELLIGSLAGAVAMMLLAQRSGSKARAKL